MPRNRLIKHDFWADEKTGTLSSDAKLLFIGAWNFADDSGVCRGNLAYLKANIFPYDAITPQKIGKLLSEIESKNLINLLEQNGESYIRVVNFEKHQVINKPSKFRYLDGDYHTTTTLLHDHYGLKEKDKVKENENENVKEVMGYLNQVSGKNFKHTTVGNKQPVNARLNEGFSVNDLKRVVDTKCQQWLNDEKMSQYIRPQTLFGTKFESYLNEGIVNDDETKLNELIKKMEAQENAD